LFAWYLKSWLKMMPDYYVPETLIGLVKQYSPTGEEYQAVEWLIKRMETLGFDRAYSDPTGNAIGIKGNGSKQLVLLGHIDTVPGQIDIRILDGVLYGRGSVDAKGPLAAFVDAVAEVEPDPEWQIVVIGAVGEEGDSRGAWAISKDFKPDFAIIGEPSRFNRITIGYKGVSRAILSIQVPLTHSASHQGSASDQLLDAWNVIKQKVADFDDMKETMFDRILLTVLRLNSSSDGFTDFAEMEVNARLPLEISPEVWINNWLKNIEGIKVTSRVVGQPAYKADKNSLLARAFLSAIRAIGEKPGYVTKSGTADLNIVAPIWGCPSVAYGPGDSALDHTPDEHLLINEYQQSIKVLKLVLENLGISCK
jgi:LysW-gamma-L-lysine carboxypeptidase